MTARKPPNVLIVDDSVVVRSIVSALLTEHAGVHCDVARNGQLALESIARSTPDLVLLDIEMPVLDGISTLREIRKTHPRLPVVMFSTLTERGASITIEALAAGANDYLTKPTGAAGLQAAREQLRVDLCARIDALCRRPAPRPPLVSQPPPLPKLAQRGAGRPVELVAIGSSTGGPNALIELFSHLPAELPVPIVVVQHMPPMFTTMLARSLDGKSPIAVAEGQDGTELLPGHAWIAPGGMHMTVQKRGQTSLLGLNQDPPECSCRPAVDVLFRSVAASHGPGVLAVVLTGMGVDGCAGAANIRAAGGQVLAQDEATSIVWGMPGAVTQAGLADGVLPLDAIAGEIVKRVTRSLTTTGGGAARRIQP